MSEESPPSARRLCSALWGAVSRTKTVDPDLIKETPLRRCLTVLDLVSLGIGSTLGVGVYILPGQVARYQAGPAVVISFLVAGVASFLSGICYAELAARVPRAGSAYTYSYVSVGELWAFIIGWNMILENVIGAAAVGKAWSQYLDSMFNDTIQRGIEEHVVTFHAPGISLFPDFIAFGLLMVSTLLVSLGVKMSSVISSTLTVLNIVVIACIMAVGFYFASLHNWTDPPGFFPYGLKGVLSGAATGFYAFVGFDTIATSGEEAQNPTRAIPNAIVATQLICFLAYFGVSSALTLMVPFNKLASTATLPKAFQHIGIPGAKYAVAIGGLCGLSAAMLGSIFPLPRIIYSMAEDGLVFSWLGWINNKTDTPMLATWISGLLAALLAMFLDLDSLVQMMSIGTLMAYSMVGTSVLVLHFQKEHVGLTATDIHMDMSPDASLVMETQTDRQSVASEDTSLLSMSGLINRMKYTQQPQQETKVFKRVISTHKDSDTDDDDDTQPTTNGQATASANDEGTAAAASTSQVTSAKHDSSEQSNRNKGVLRRMPRYGSDNHNTPSDNTYQRVESNYSLHSVNQVFNFGDDKTNEPTPRSRLIAMTSFLVLVFLWTSLCILSVYGGHYITTSQWWAILLIVIIIIAIIILFIVMQRQPRNVVQLNFRVPLVPFVPTITVLVNIYLMVCLSGDTWIRFAVWMTLGAVIYGGYGLWHSKERRSTSQEVILYNISDADSMLVDGVYR